MNRLFMWRQVIFCNRHSVLGESAKHTVGEHLQWCWVTEHICSLFVHKKWHELIAQFFLTNSECTETVHTKVSDVECATVVCS